MKLICLSRCGYSEEEDAVDFVEESKNKLFVQKTCLEYQCHLLIGLIVICRPKKVHLICTEIYRGKRILVDDGYKI